MDYDDLMDKYNKPEWGDFYYEQDEMKKMLINLKKDLNQFQSSPALRAEMERLEEARREFLPKHTSQMLVHKIKEEPHETDKPNPNPSCNNIPEKLNEEEQNNEKGLEVEEKQKKQEEIKRKGSFTAGEESKKKDEIKRRGSFTGGLDIEKKGEDENHQKRAEEPRVGSTVGVEETDKLQIPEKRKKKKKAAYKRAVSQSYLTTKTDLLKIKYRRIIWEVEQFLTSTLDELKDTFQKLKNVAGNIILHSDPNNKPSVQETPTFDVKNGVIQVFSVVSWLENYAIINQISFHNIINHFEKKNPDEKLSVAFASFKRKRWRFFSGMIDIVQTFKNEVIQFYADKYTEGQFIRARNKMIRGLKHESQCAKTSNWVLGAVNISIFITYFLLTYLPKKENAIVAANQINIFFAAFNFFFMVLLVFLGSAILIQIFSKYRVNYVFLFELNSDIKITSEKYLQGTMIMSIVFGVIVLAYRISLTFYPEQFQNYFYVFSLIIILIFFLGWFFPFNIASFNLRVQLFYTVLKQFFPFGKKGVKFRDFIFGDILTSLVKPMTSLTLAFCLIYCRECREDNTKSTCTRNNWVALAIQITPYLTRLFQCINRLYYTGLPWPHLVNMFKYATAVTSVIVSFLYAKKIITNVAILISISAFSAAYSLFWDFVVDWRVFQSYECSTFLLRKNLMLPKWVYYWCMFSNAIIRFLWTCGLYQFSIDEESNNFIFCSLEIYRRMQWLMIRVENEQVNNPEKYRDFGVITELPIQF